MASLIRHALECIEIICENLTPVLEPIVYSIGELYPANPPNKRFEKMSVSVVNADSLNIALHYASTSKTIMLNMANPRTPGGNPHIVGSQEEDIFRRTDLKLHLMPEFYPLNTRLIYSRSVRVFLRGLRENYSIMSQTGMIDIVSCSAVKNNNIGTELNSRDAREMYFKIIAILELAYKHGYESVVLSAFGCSGFCCPPEHVSQLFKKALDYYDGAFKTVIFAIWNENQPKSNFAVFNETFM